MKIRSHEKLQTHQLLVWINTPTTLVVAERVVIDDMADTVTWG